MRGSVSGWERRRGSGKNAGAADLLAWLIDGHDDTAADIVAWGEDERRLRRRSDGADELADRARIRVVRRDAMRSAALLGHRIPDLRRGEPRLQHRCTRSRHDLSRGEGECEIPEEAAGDGHRHENILYIVPGR